MTQIAPPESPARRVAPGATVGRMAREISQRELRNESGRIMRELEAGERFVITRNGNPIGELVPLRRPQFISREALLEGMRGAPRIDLAELRRDMDRYVDPYFEPREW